MKDYKKYYIIDATPEIVYNALTNEATLQLWTGEEASMPSIAGEEFSLWSGSINGKVIELTPFKKIVQEWYFGEQTEASIVTIILHSDKNRTSAELRHTNIPDEDFEDITQGWDEHFFGSLINFYED